VSKQRDYLSEDEVTRLVTLCKFVAPLCFGPTGIWIEGVNPKQVGVAQRFVMKLRKMAAKQEKVTP
jgi:hypothetical protein